jgi:hypothetical protein
VNQKILDQSQKIGGKSEVLQGKIFNTLYYVMKHKMMLFNVVSNVVVEVLGTVCHGIILYTVLYVLFVAVLITQAF